MQLSIELTIDIFVDRITNPALAQKAADEIGITCT
jgi:hypothetical protein